MCMHVCKQCECTVYRQESYGNMIMQILRQYWALYYLHTHRHTQTNTHQHPSSHTYTHTHTQTLQATATPKHTHTHDNCPPTHQQTHTHTGRYFKTRTLNGFEDVCRIVFVLMHMCVCVCVCVCPYILANKLQRTE